MIEDWDNLALSLDLLGLPYDPIGRERRMRDKTMISKQGRIDRLITTLCKVKGEAR